MTKCAYSNYVKMWIIMLKCGKLCYNVHNYVKMCIMMFKFALLCQGEHCYMQDICIEDSSNVSINYWQVPVKNNLVGTKEPESSLYPGLF